MAPCSRRATTHVGYGAVLAALGGIAYWGPKLWGRTMPTGRSCRSALLGFVAIALASCPYLVAGFAKQPADTVVFRVLGDNGSITYDSAGLASSGTCWPFVGHVLMAITVLGFIGLAVKSFTSDEDERLPATIRGTARRWSGRPRRRRPPETSLTCRWSRRPSRCST